MIPITPPQQARLADPLEPGQLAVAVEAVAAGEHGLGPDASSCGTTIVTPGPHRALPDDQRPVALDQRGVAHQDARDVRDRVVLPGFEQADPQAKLSSAHGPPVVLPGGDPRAPADRPYHRRVPSHPGSPSRRATALSPSGCPLPSLDGVAPMDAAEAFRDLPGLALLESARPGRTARWSYLTADPVAVLDAPSEGPDPFAEARALLARLDRRAVRRRGGAAVRRRARRASSGYDLGRRFERLPSIARVDQRPAGRCGSRCTTGRSPGTGGRAEAWLGSRRSTSGIGAPGSRGCAEVRARLAGPRDPARRGSRAVRRRRRARTAFSSGIDARGLDRGVEVGPRSRSAGARSTRPTSPAGSRPRSRRPVAAVPTPADRRSGAVRGVPRPRAVAR